MDSRNDEASVYYERVLALASLFDDDFSADWIADLLEIKPLVVLEALSSGVAKGLIARKGYHFFSFSDQKSRKSYQSRLSFKKRERLHESIVNILIRDLPEGDAKIRTIANHLLQINGKVNECKLLMAAGESFLYTFDMEKARLCFNKILSNLSDCTRPEEDNLIVRAAIKFSKSSTAGSKTSEVLHILTDAMERAHRLDNPRYVALVELHLAKTKWLRSQYRSAFQHFKNGLNIAKALDDSKLLRSATNFRIVALFWRGRFKEVIETYEALVPEIERVPHGDFPLLAALTVGRCYVHIGQVSHGLGMLDAIYSLCKDKGDRYLSCHCQFTIGATMMDIQHLDKAIDLFQQSIAAAQREHNDWVLILGNLMLAYAYYLTNQKEPAVQAIKAFIYHRKRAEVTVQPYPYVLDLCMAIRQGKLPPVPDLVLKEEMDRMIKGNNVFIKGIAYCFQAILKRMDGRPTDDIFASLEKSSALLGESGHCIGLAKTKIEVARQYLLEGNRDQSVQNTQRAAELIENFSTTIIPEDLLPLIKSPSSKKSLLQEIFTLGQNLGTLRDNQVLVQRIISTANGITGAERGAIFRLEKNNDRLQPALIASRNLTPEQIEHPGFEDSRKMIARVAKTGKSLIQETAPSGNTLTQEGKAISSSICVPMILRNEVVGVLYLDNRLLKSSFKNDDLELLSFFASQAALALDNANAYQKIQQLNQKLKKEKEYYQEESRQGLNFDGLVGNSDAIREVMRQTHLVAATDSTVLIVGETGVGKELIARAIHQQSSRNNKPFIKVNTSALATHIIPSELFGHEKGAFTGASQRRIGRFELANGGTLFLDEVGEISLDVQVSLLRVLQTKEFERVGGDAIIKSDFRLVAATNRDLLQDVRKGLFRSDLYFRINVFPITVPPLRTRQTDIELLTNHFLKIQSATMRKVFHDISPDELSKLKNYDWPGNIRELQNIVERGSILNSGPVFHVPELITGAVAPSPELSSDEQLVTLEENERRHILLALQQCNGKVRGSGGAAEILDINPSTLYFRIKKLGIQGPATK